MCQAYKDHFPKKLMCYLGMFYLLITETNASLSVKERIDWFSMPAPHKYKHRTMG